MHRFFVPSASLAGDDIVVSGEPLHHLTVLRLRVGDEVLLLDGSGLVCRCRLTTFSRAEAHVQVLERWHETERILPLRLLQGLPKGDKMDLILQKGVELGVTAFTPVLTERSVTIRAKGDRWERIVQEAARQSRRPVLPRLDNLMPLDKALAATTESLRLMLWEEENQPLAALLPTTPPHDCALLVGPEGGFTPDEAALARECGFVPVSLGRRILRTETAGFAVAAILQHRYGDLGSLTLR